MSTPTLVERVKTAERDFTQLAYLARALAREGHPRQSVYDVYEQCRTDADARDDQQTVDRLCDVMDHIVGFCSPHLAITFADDKRSTESEL